MVSIKKLNNPESSDSTLGEKKWLKEDIEENILIMI